MVGRPGHSMIMNAAYQKLSFDIYMLQEILNYNLCDAISKLSVSNSRSPTNLVQLISFAASKLREPWQQQIWSRRKCRQPTCNLVYISRSGIDLKCRIRRPSAHQGWKNNRLRMLPGCRHRPGYRLCSLHRTLALIWYRDTTR